MGCSSSRRVALAAFAWGPKVRPDDGLRDACFVVDLDRNLSSGAISSSDDAPELGVGLESYSGLKVTNGHGEIGSEIGHVLIVCSMVELSSVTEITLTIPTDGII
jgi:hypothetical protein